ncbi:DUF2625 family protein [Actinopolymorpha pittospori]|uniref:DUF2625 domain-containing protein n=1 Tax=Actinopolymorpha pittospori TaxID=648752 RepID=A0A927MRR0_9ACTN|nr:hypothetical protein [Actinopolymorpha pittospori]
MDSAAWDEILAAAQAARYPVEMLAPDADRAESCLANLGITVRSWLGAVITHTGGICVDHGWLRVLGSGGTDLPDVATDADPASRGLVIGFDVLGGQFAWVPAEPGAPPTVHYFAPDTLDWLDLEQGYAAWLHAVLTGSLTQFYDALRWPGWETEVAALGLSEGIHTWPPPSTVQGQDLANASRKAVPMAELIYFHHELAKQLS